MSNYKEDEQKLQSLLKEGDLVWKNWYDDMRDPFRLFFIKYGNVDPDLAIELFHEAMVIFHRNVFAKKLTTPLQSTLKTYLFGIGKMLYLKKGGKTDNWQDEIPDHPVMPEVEMSADQKEKAALVKSLLQRIGEPCKQLLELIYINGYVMEAVANEMGFPSEGAVRKRKFDCLKKMRKMI